MNQAKLICFGDRLFSHLVVDVAHDKCLYQNLTHSFANRSNIDVSNIIIFNFQLEDDYVRIIRSQSSVSIFKLLAFINIKHCRRSVQRANQLVTPETLVS